MIEWWEFKWWECDWCCCSEWFGHSVCHATGSSVQRPVSQLQGILDGHSILLDMALMPNVIFDCQLKNRIGALDRSNSLVGLERYFLVLQLHHLVHSLICQIARAVCCWACSIGSLRFVMAFIPEGIFECKVSMLGWANDWMMGI